MADIHGNDVALRAVLDDAASCRVDRWWVLGNLVLFGPRPAEVLKILRSLPDIEMLRGNTDRYVLTGEQPAPHARRRRGGKRRTGGALRIDGTGIGWTRGDWYSVTPSFGDFNLAPCGDTGLRPGISEFEPRSRDIAQERPARRIFG